jgi:ABC-type polysaccharide/polyol phosphate export permease
VQFSTTMENRAQLIISVCSSVLSLCLCYFSAVFSQLLKVIDLISQVMVSVIKIIWRLEPIFEFEWGS